MVRSHQASRSLPEAPAPAEKKRKLWLDLGAMRSANNIAPEIDIATIDPAADLHEAMDIDSMDFLNFITAIHHRLGIDIPEIEYPKLFTLDGAIAYIDAKLKSIKKGA
jgi:acyl carrier protein